jgi:molybdate transport system regulatory protein
MELKVKLYLTDEDDDKFMGIGVLWLLQRITKYHSIRKAAGEMRMSYAKALSLLSKLEKNLENPLTIRKKGGDSRIGTELTPFGEKFINLYEDFQNNVKESARAEFISFTRDLSALKPDGSLK